VSLNTGVELGEYVPLQHVRLAGPFERPDLVQQDIHSENKGIPGHATALDCSIQGQWSEFCMVEMSTEIAGLDGSNGAEILGTICVLRNCAQLVDND